jgi:transposase
MNCPDRRERARRLLRYPPEMEDEERQRWIDEVAKRDAIIERQSAEITVLKQTIDALCRRVFGKSSEQLDYKRGEFRRIRLVRGKYVRKSDVLAKPVVAPVPPSLLDRCIATPGLIAEVIDNRFACHLPYYRQAEIFSRQGVSFHRKTLCDWAALGADWLSSVYRAIQREHWRSRYRQFDETPIDSLEPGSGKAQAGYLWASNIPAAGTIPAAASR